MKKISVLLITFLTLTSSIACSSKQGVDPEDQAVAEAEIVTNAKNYYQSGMYSISREAWQELRDKFPASYYIPLAEIKIADCYFYSREYTEAIVAYEDFVKLRPTHEATPYALYQIAESNFLQYKGPQHDQDPILTASKLLENLLERFPNTFLKKAAQDRIAQANELLAQHETFVARFYIEQEMYDAAINRIENLFSKFAQTKTTKYEVKKLIDLMQSKDFDQQILEKYNKMAMVHEKISQDEPELNSSFSDSALKKLQKLSFTTK